jgi:hypothetical protein
MFRTIMEQLETDPVPLGTSHIPNHIPPRRCGGLCFKRPCASRRDTPHERARARDEHHSPAMPTAHAFYAGDGARDRERAGFRVSGRCRRRVVGRVFGSSTEERNRARHCAANLIDSALGRCVYVPSAIRPGPPCLRSAAKDRKSARAHVVKFGSLLVWGFCR